MLFEVLFLILKILSNCTVKNLPIIILNLVSLPYVVDLPFSLTLRHLTILF